MEDYDENIYINRHTKFVRVGDVSCNSDFRNAFFENFDCFMGIRESIRLLNNKLEFGNQSQINALQAYQAITIWEENFG